VAWFGLLPLAPVGCRRSCPNSSHAPCPWERRVSAYSGILNTKQSRLKQPPLFKPSKTQGTQATQKMWKNKLKEKLARGATFTGKAF